MGVPAAFVVDGDVWDPTFDQPARYQAGLPEGIATVAVSQRVLLLREIKYLARVAKDQVVGLLLTLLGGCQLGIARHGLLKRIELLEQLASVALTLVGNPWSHNAFHCKPALPGVAPSGKGLVTRSQKARLGKPPLRLGQHDVRRKQSPVSRLGPFEQRDDGPYAWEDIPAALRPSGLDHVGGRFMAIVAVSHAADDGILVGLFCQERH